MRLKLKDHGNTLTYLHSMTKLHPVGLPFGSPFSYPKALPIAIALAFFALAINVTADIRVRFLYFFIGEWYNNLKAVI